MSDDTLDTMDIDGPEFINEVNAQIATIRSHKQDTALDVPLFDTDYKDIQSFSKVAVVDTNFLISNLSYLKTLLSLAEEKLGSLLILIPWVVIRELDGLKNPSPYSDKGQSVSSLSRSAMKFLEEQLRNKVKCLRGQKLNETIKQRDMQNDKLKGDDLILDCCMYFQSTTQKEVILLSNDRNLCIKVMIHEIDSISAESKHKMDHFTKDINARKAPKEVVKEEDCSMEIDDEYTVYEDYGMMDIEQPITNTSFKPTLSESKWAKTSPVLTAPRRPTPPPFEVGPPMLASDRSTWASIHAPKYH